MQGLGMIRLRNEDFAVNPLRFGNAAGLMVFKRDLQFLFNRRRRHLRNPFN
jgi:hypothetical protein